MSDFGEVTKPAARKAYRCIWCSEDVVKGEKHVRYAGVWQGDWQFWRMHDECYAVYDPTECPGGFEPYACKRGSTEER